MIKLKIIHFGLCFLKRETLVILLRKFRRALNFRALNFRAVIINFEVEFRFTDASLIDLRGSTIKVVIKANVCRASANGAFLGHGGKYT